MRIALVMRHAVNARQRPSELCSLGPWIEFTRLALARGNEQRRANHDAKRGSQTVHRIRSSARAEVLPSRECEHIEHASLRGALLEVAHRVRKATRGTAVARIDVVEYDGSGPATHARQHGDVLLAVRSSIRDRLTDDSGLGLELPEQLAAFRVDRLEPAVHRAVKTRSPAVASAPLHTGKSSLIVHVARWATGSHAVTRPRPGPGPGFI